MRTTRSIRGAVGLAIAACAAGCGGGNGGGGSGEAVDFSALHAEYAAPSGALTGPDIAAVARALSRAQQTAGVPMGASARVRIAPVGGASSPQSAPEGTLRPQGGSGSFSYACPGGGNITETASSAENGYVSATLQYDACAFQETGGGATASGTISFADYQGPPLMLIYKGELAVTITPPGTTEQIDMNYALVNGQLTYSVELSSGNVLVSAAGSWDPATDSGSFTVIDKSGTWSCTYANGSGSCTGPGGTVSG